MFTLAYSYIYLVVFHYKKFMQADVEWFANLFQGVKIGGIDFIGAEMTNRAWSDIHSAGEFSLTHSPFF